MSGRRGPSTQTPSPRSRMLVVDLRITQVVNGKKGVHVMLEKRFLKGRA